MLVVHDMGIINNIALGVFGIALVNVLFQCGKQFVFLLLLFQAT